MRRGLMSIAAAAALVVSSAGLASAGTGWVIQPTPIPAGAHQSSLDAVSCVTAADCTAVGYYYDGTGDVLMVAEHWNGSTWSIQTMPNPAGSTDNLLSSISCASATSCTTTGEYFSPSVDEATLAEHWDGGTWGIQPTTRSAVGKRLWAVSCTAASTCTAVGDTGPGTTAMPVQVLPSTSRPARPQPAGLFDPGAAS